jgi:FlaG/FlaF family flagellin (archaellin)
MAMLGVIAIVVVLAAVTALVVLVLAGRASEPPAHPSGDPRDLAQQHYDAMQRGAENQRNNSSGSGL